MPVKRSPAEFASMVVEDWDSMAPRGLASYPIEVVRLARAYLGKEQSPTPQPERE